MSWETALIGLGGVILSAVSFLFGRVFSQSEKILDRKREAYRDFLKSCPSPNEAHLLDADLPVEMQRETGILTLYASHDALKFAGEYFQVFADSQLELSEVQTPGHPTYLKVLTAYNRMVWAMRVDVMTWSVFAPKRSARQFRPDGSTELANRTTD